jgi:hypothetical protein
MQSLLVCARKEKTKTSNITLFLSMNALLELRQPTVTAGRGFQGPLEIGSGGCSLLRDPVGIVSSNASYLHNPHFYHIYWPLLSTSIEIER